MPDRDESTPRVFLARHGETEWTRCGRFTGRTDIELTEHGKRQVTATSAHLVGPGKLIDPSRITHFWVSPRKRAQDTLELLFGKIFAHSEKITVSEDIAEWDYGDYEGLVIGQIHERRKMKDLDEDVEYNIWRDGCEGGESMVQVTARLDRLISAIRDIQRPYMNGEKPADVILVAHGHILRAFVKRWLGYSVDFPLRIMMLPGAVSVLSYQNHDIEAPALHIGMSLPS